MSKRIINIPDSIEIGNLGVMHLKRYWQKCQLKKDGSLASDAFPEEWNIDITLLSALGLGLEQTLKEIYNTLKNFNDFENWVLSINNGELPKEKIEQFNRYILNRENGIVAGEIEKVLDESDISFWNEYGYLIIRNVISGQDCEDTINAICDFIDIERDDPSTWYNNHPARQ